MDSDLLTLDRRIALAARALDTWRGELPADPGRDRDDPFVSWADLTKPSLLQAIARATITDTSMSSGLLLPDFGDAKGVTKAGPAATFDDPLASLRTAALSWCAHFVLARGLRTATVGRCSAMRDEQDCDAHGRSASFRGMLRSLARPRQAGGVPEPKARAALEELGAHLLTPVLAEERERSELAEGLGEHARCCAAPAPEAVAAADRFLQATRDEAQEVLAHGLHATGRGKERSWVDVLAVRRAADVAEGWPATLSARWLAEQSRGTELLSGIPLDVRVDAGRLSPRADHAGLHLSPPTGAWTFARALRALGIALRLHGRDPRTPFGPHVLPHDPRPYVMGVAFEGLLSSTTFHARARNVVKPKADAGARRLAATRLLERRHLALRVRLAPELLRGRRAFQEAFDDLAPAALGCPVPSALAAYLGAPGPLGPAEDAALFSSFEAGDALARTLVERFDDDWWRNPKAAPWIRDRCAR